MLALYEVDVVLIVAAGADQDTQEVQIITQILNKCWPHTVKKKTIKLNQILLNVLRNESRESFYVMTDHVRSRFA